MNHVFLPGHRIMVQIQSSWFPLYDRNPQTLCGEYLFREAGGLCEGDVSVFRAAGSGERGVAAGGGGGAVRKDQSAMTVKLRRKNPRDLDLMLECRRQARFKLPSGSFPCTI